MRSPPSPISSNRLARLIVYARAVFLWVAASYFGNLVANSRRIRQRYRLLSLDTLTHLVRNLMIARAGQLFGRARPKRITHDASPAGFRRRRLPGNALRALAGSRLRRYLRGGDFAQRFARLAAILRNLDHYVRVFFARRAARGFTRLRPIVLVRPPASALASLAAPATFESDTS